MFGVGMGLGLFNAVTTLIEQLVKPAGYDKDDAANFGALLIGYGLVSAAIIGPVMDATISEVGRYRFLESRAESEVRCKQA